MISDLIKQINMAVIGEVIVGKIIDKVVDLGLDYLMAWQQSGSSKDIQLESLKKAVPRIKLVVELAERMPGQITKYPSLREWLQQLKDAIYEADDVIDDLEYFRLEQQVLLSEEASSQNKMCSTVTSLIQQKIIPFVSKRVKYDPIIVEKLREAIKRLNEVASNMGDFLAILKSEADKDRQEDRNISNRETGSLLTESRVVGRDKEQEILLQWLKEDPVKQGQEQEGSSHNNVSLFSIVGHGGIGKTTLAQLVFNDQSIQSSYDPKIWVCVSTSSDVKVLTAAMLESATRKKPKLSTLTTLQEALKHELISSKKKYLLVLDDAWDKIHDWPKLLFPLTDGSKGGKILLTTRMNLVAESVARAIGGAKESMKLESIENDTFFQLFNQCAFAGEKPDDYPKLLSIGKQIAKKLGGSPLAAKVLGALLNQNLNELYWNKILHTNFLDHASECGEGNITPILMLSYQSLPVCLRPCFVYCSTFPQDYRFEKEVLVHMWIAVGLIQQTPQNPRDNVLEDVGSLYFDELVKSSFLEPSHYNDRFVMHDLLHELACSVSNGECFSFVGDELDIDFPNTILHLYFQTNDINLLAEVNKLKNLRTLLFNFTGVSNSSGENANVFERVIKSLKSVRVLLLVAPRMQIKVVGDVIGNLTHLRFLSFDVSNDDSNEMDNFLKSICRLYHLQILNNKCLGEIDFPESINRLINLRHLKPIGRTRNILGIGRLVNLQELIFLVRKESAKPMAQLMNLNQLRELEIGGLENVLSCEEASMVELQKKGKLQKLKLRWTPGFTEMGKDEEILDGLHVPSKVKNLDIKGYGGCRSANWMETALREKEVEYVELNECSRWELLPPLERLPYLKHLKLEKLPAVKKIDFSEDGYAQLKVLEIAEMEQLEEWSLADSTSKVEIYQRCPRLDDLKIKGCPKLQVLPSLPFSLKTFWLENVGLTVLPTISPPSGPSLSELYISGCKHLTSLSEGLLQQNLVALKEVRIKNCEELVALPVQGFRHLCSLEYLYIDNCPKLQQQQVLASSGEDGYYLLPSSLRYLRLRGCGDWVRSLPTLLHGGLTSLERLELVYCESLTSLPSKEVWRTLTSLKELTIIRCPNIVAQQSTMEEQEKVDSTSTIEDLDIDDPSLLLLIEPLRSLTSVCHLEIDDCGKLESMDGELERWLLQNSRSLRDLNLYNAVSLKSLPCTLQTLSSLRWLQIRNATSLESVPQLPSSLNYLYIDGCNKTLKERLKKDEGADWTHIKHIPNIDIEDEGGLSDE